MNGDRGRLPVGLMVTVCLLAADVRGLVDLGAWARTGAGVTAGAVVGVARGSATVLASTFPTRPPARPRRKRKVVRSDSKPRNATSPPAAAAPSRAARAGIPLNILRLYREAGAGESWPDSSGRRYAAWAVLAGIGLVESSHGRSNAPGVRSGVNAFGCCAGPMQFNLRNGPPSTWDTWGRGNVYDPRDAIPAAARKLRGDGARRNLDRALLAYNASSAYVAGVKAQARRYQQGV